MSLGGYEGQELGASNHDTHIQELALINNRDKNHSTQYLAMSCKVIYYLQDLAGYVGTGVVWMGMVIGM